MVNKRLPPLNLPRLIHYSHEPFALNRRHHYNGAGYMKPAGFWVSVEGEDDWPAWCEAENFGLGKHPYLVTLSQDARVLHVTTGAELEAFHKEFSKPGELSRRTKEIQWGALATRYDGLIIAPYQWEHRMAREFMWYYCWDCASGVFWNLDAIDNVNLLTEP